MPVWPWDNRKRTRTPLPSKYYERYERVDTVPDGIKWKPAGHAPAKDYTRLLSTPGELYMLERSRTTGEVTHYRRKDVEEKSLDKTIDIEPAAPKQVRYRVGVQCWFVDTGGRWYLCRVAAREPGRIAIESVTGFDADRTSAWPYGELLEFPDKKNNPLFQRLRPLKARYQ